MSPAKARYPLCSPRWIWASQLRNRVWMGSMHRTGRSRPRLQGCAYFAERAEGGVGLIVTGGTERGGLAGPLAASCWPWEVRAQQLTAAAHQHGAKICSCAGRYAYHPLSVAPSKLKAPISPFTRARCRPVASAAYRADAQRKLLARAALQRGDGWARRLPHQRVRAPRTNKRSDRWGGDATNACALQWRSCAASAGLRPGLIIIYRLSLVDLVDDGNNWVEIVQQAQAIEAAGATIANSGIGWHEARIRPSPPRCRVRPSPVSPPNKPHDAAAGGDPTASTCPTSPNASSLAAPVWCRWHVRCWPTRNGPTRPVQAARKRQYLHRLQPGLPGPRVRASWPAAWSIARRARDRTGLSPHPPKKVAVVGAGPAGLACATVAAQRGYQVTLFDATMRSAARTTWPAHPRKSSKPCAISATSWPKRRRRCINTRADASSLAGFDEVVLATGITPAQVASRRRPRQGGQLSGRTAGPRRSGHCRDHRRRRHRLDVGEFLSHAGESPSLDPLDGRGVDASFEARSLGRQVEPSPRRLWLLQRSAGKPARDWARPPVGSTAPH